MSLKYDIDGFNEETYKRLFKTQEKVGEGLSPDNISFLYGDSIDYTNKSEIEFLQEATINGIGVNNIYELIGYLKTSKTELTHIEKEFDILSDRCEFTIEIPDSFDGRNAFVLTSWNFSEALGGSKVYPFQADAIKPINKMFYNRDGNSEPYKASFLITKNKRAIKFSINNFDKDSINDKYWYCKVLILLWRTI